MLTFVAGLFTGSIAILAILSLPDFLQKQPVNK